MAGSLIRSADWNYGGSKWKLSRAKIEAYMTCPHCFYLNNKLGLKDLTLIPYTLNSTVDMLLKKEFDEYRSKQEPHPYQIAGKVPAIPAEHSKLNDWRENFVGIQHRLPNGIIVSGAIDDLWVTTNHAEPAYIVVDYKSTAAPHPVEELNDSYHRAYQRQMDIYQWLLLQQGLKMSEYGCFVYCTADQSAESFDSKLNFTVKLIPYKTDPTWVESMIYEAIDCLESATPPASAPDCNMCGFAKARASLT
jgi:hypothetical protein